MSLKSSRNRVDFTEQELCMLRATLVRWQKRVEQEKAQLVKDYCPVQVGDIIRATLDVKKQEAGATTLDPLIEKRVAEAIYKTVPLTTVHTPIEVRDKPLRVAEIRLVPYGFALTVQAKSSNDEKWGQPVVLYTVTEDGDE